MYCIFFNDAATTEIDTYCHTLALLDALPIWKNDGKILPLDVRDPSHDCLLVADLALRHLAGAADRKPFAHRHRTGAGNQSRYSCKENRAFFRARARYVPAQMHPPMFPRVNAI